MKFCRRLIKELLVNLLTWLFGFSRCGWMTYVGPIYTYRLRQSLSLCQQKWTVWWTEWVQSPFWLSNGPSPYTQRKFDRDGHGHDDGDCTCKQAPKFFVRFVYLDNVNKYTAFQGWLGYIGSFSLRFQFPPFSERAMSPNPSMDNSLYLVECRRDPVSLNVW